MDTNFELERITKTTSEIAQDDYNTYTLDFKNKETTKTITLSGLGKIKEIVRV